MIDFMRSASLSISASASRSGWPGGLPSCNSIA